MTDVLRAAWRFLTGDLTVVAILVSGVLLTVVTGFVQFRRLPQAFSATFRKQSGGGDISVFGSLCTALSATIGTGNIIGVASAIAIGGAGALFWMELAGVLGMATRYSENLLAVRYRTKDRNGNVLGGPFAYMERGLHGRLRLLAPIFAAACLLTGLLGMGPMTQSNAIAMAFTRIFAPEGQGELFRLGGVSVGAVTLLAAIVTTLLTGFAICGGIRRIAKVSEMLVPFMALGYLVLSFVILWVFRAEIPAALASIFRGAFAPKAALGGFGGAALRRTVTIGFKRGVFSNEAGLGTAPIAAAAAQSDAPVVQGLSGIVTVFIDTTVICTVTCLVVLVTGVHAESAEGAYALTGAAWEVGLGLPRGYAGAILGAFTCLFAFTTIIGWDYFVERCLTYLFPRARVMGAYRALYLLATFLGAFLSASVAWQIADAMNVFMALPNLTALIALRGEVKEETARYFGRKKAAV